VSSGWINRRSAAGAACTVISMLATAAAQAAHAVSQKTITDTQFARQADRVCAQDYKQQKALGPGLINADIVTRAHLSKAGAYLDKIVSITNTEVSGLAALGTTKRGMRQRHLFIAALHTALADERAAAAAAHKRDLAGFRAAFDRLILHGHPTRPDYRKLIVADKAAARIFPFKTCGKSTAIYPKARPTRRPTPTPPPDRRRPAHQRASDTDS
jgi:hypothetical protein